MRKTKAFYGGYNIIVDDKNEALKDDSNLIKNNENKTITITISCFINMLSQGVLKNINGKYLDRTKIEKFMSDLNKELNK